MAGLVAGLLGAFLWGVITTITGYQIGYMAVAIGYIVGISIRKAGKGLDQEFGFLGGGIALVSCILGNFVGIIGTVSIDQGMEVAEVLSMIDLMAIPQIMIETFTPIDILFYGIALYEGYKFSFRVIQQEDLT